MSRIPTWLYILFGLLALVAGVLGVTHAPSGPPKTFWALVTVLGAASLLYTWTSSRRHKSSAQLPANRRPG